MGGTAFVPTLSLDAGLTHYLAEIRKFPMLRPDQESAYAKRWREQGDREAAYHLVTSHLRLVAKIAMRYRGYGLPIADIISEGNVGLMQAVKRFEPERGFRLATYAMWWIKASIQEYILRSWSLVKMGTNAAQKKLFFKLRRTKAEISALEDGDLRPEHIAMIAKRLGVQENDVVEMNRRLGGDVHSTLWCMQTRQAKCRTGSSTRHPVPKPCTPTRRKPNSGVRRSPEPWKSSTRASAASLKRGSCPNRRSGLRSSRHDLAFRASGCGRSKFAHLKKFGLQYAPDRRTRLHDATVKQRRGNDCRGQRQCLEGYKPSC